MYQDVRELVLENEIITFYNNNEDIRVNHAEAFKQINAGDRIKIDSRGLIVEIISVDSLVESIRSGYVEFVGSNKAVDVINKKIILDALTDFEFMQFVNMRKNKVHLSVFTNRAEDVIKARNLLISSARIKV